MADRRFQPKKKPSGRRPNITLLVLLVFLLVGSVLLFWPPDTSIHQGLDVQGGLSVVLQASKTDGSDVTSEDMQLAQTIIDQRVNMLGASEASVQVQGTDQLMVQIPGIVDQTAALSTIGSVGVLEFVDLSTIEDEAVVSAIQSGAVVNRDYLKLTGAFSRQPDLPVNAKLFVQDTSSADDENAPTRYYLPTMTYYNPLTYAQLPIAEMRFSGPWKAVQLTPGTYTPILTGENINTVSVGRNEGSAYYVVNIKLDEAGTKAFADATTALYLTKGTVMIVLDGYVQSTPSVNSIISDGNVSITGNFNAESAYALSSVLQSGSLPVTLEVSSAQVVGPTLGQDALRAGILVAIIGLALVAIYLLIFYRGLGLLTAAAILVFAVLYLGVLALLSFFGFFSLTLAGIAGIVLAIGVAADSSILVLERFKEEIRMGRSVRASSISGVRHAIQTSIDADLVTAVSALALFIIGVGSVKGFGLTLVIGVVCDILTMVLFKAPIIRLMAPGLIANNPAFWGIKEDEQVAQASGELKRGVQNG
ncbi:MAG: protein translocase subunit SecD [Coriobacteriales bacterium]|jgi:SecD/SecF fusion protein|nr:protein translocase subunit SecD [Coriobacteriales bacterium]